MMIQMFLIMAIICLTYSIHAYSTSRVNDQEFLNVGSNCPSVVLPAGSQGYTSKVPPSNPFSIVSGVGCITFCQKDLKTGQVLLALGHVKDKSCTCYYGELNKPGSKIACSLEERLTTTFYIPRYSITLSLGSYTLAGDANQLNQRYSFIGPKFKSYVDKYISEGRGQGPTIDHPHQHGVWKGNKDNYCQWRFTKSFDYGVHRCRSGPFDSVSISTTIVWTETLKNLGAYDSFFGPMFALYSKLYRAETGTYVDNQIERWHDPRQCYTGMCPDNGLRTIGQTTMYSSPRSMVATFWDNNAKTVLGNVNFNTNYKTLYQYCASASTNFPCLVNSNYDTTKSVLSTIMSTAVGVGLIIKFVGIATLIGGFVFCNKMEEEIESMRSIVENRHSFCNNLAANNASTIGPEELEMCNRLVWQPSEWFQKNDENKIAGSMLESNCTTIDNRNITEIVDNFGVDENKLLNAQSKCFELMEEYHDEPDQVPTPGPTSSKQPCEELVKIPCRKRTDCKFVGGLCKTKQF